MTFLNTKRHLQGEINLIWNHRYVWQILKVFLTQEEKQQQSEAGDQGDEQGSGGGRQGDDEETYSQV